jgi:hypothetical protein
MSMKKIQTPFVAAAAALLLAACGSTGDTSSDSGATLTVQPPAVSLSPLATRTFSAAGAASAATRVVWSIQEGTTGGTVTAGGTYTAPATIGQFHVVATSVADPTKSASATVTVTAASSVAVVVSPKAVSLLPGGSQTFTASVTGTVNPSVTWTVQEGASGGAVSSAGAYTAPSTPGTYHVVATSVVDGTKNDAATVTVAPQGTGGGTSVPGGTLSTQTWTVAGSPYRVTGNITIASGQRLTIEPGVTVEFQGHYKLLAVGRLTAQGTASAKILFTHKDRSNAVGWNGLRFIGVSGGAPLVGGQGDIVEHCIFEYGYKSDTGSAPQDAPYSEVGGGAVYWDGGAYTSATRTGFTFNNNEIRFCKATLWGGGMLTTQHTEALAITGNNFHDNQQTTTDRGYGGGLCTLHASAFTVRGGEFRNNSARVLGGGIAFYEVVGTLDSIIMTGNTVNGAPSQYGSGASTVTVINTPAPP